MTHCFYYLMSDFPKALGRQKYLMFSRKIRLDLWNMAISSFYSTIWINFQKTRIGGGRILLYIHMYELNVVQSETTSLLKYENDLLQELLSFLMISSKSWTIIAFCLSIFFIRYSKTPFEWTTVNADIFAWLIFRVLQLKNIFAGLLNSRWADAHL